MVIRQDEAVSEADRNGRLPSLPCLRPESELQRTLLQLAFGFSPRVEPVATDAVMLDIEGLESLFGPPKMLAKMIQSRAAEWSMPVNIAIAQHTETALVAARGIHGMTIIPPSQEQRVLGSLPLTLLGATPEMEQTWRLWGLRTLGDLAALPENGIAERLGAEGARLHRMARGKESRPLIPFIPAPNFEASRQLEYPVERIEPLSFILASLLNQICASLAVRGKAASHIHLRLQLEAAGNSSPSFERSLHLPVPLGDSVALLKLLRLDLEAHPPSAPVIAVHLRADAAPPQVMQNGLFLPPTPEPGKLEITLARIAKLVGKENAGSPELLDTHRSDAFAMHPFCAPSHPSRDRKGAVAHVPKQFTVPNESSRCVFRTCLQTPDRRPRLKPHLLRSTSGASQDEEKKPRAGVSPALYAVPQSGAPTQDACDGPAFSHRDDALFSLPKIFSAAHAIVPFQNCEPFPHPAGQQLHPESHRLLACRIFRPPLWAEVQCSGTRPASIRAPGIRGRIVCCAGPWCTSGDWWTANPWQREEWDISVRQIESNPSHDYQGAGKLLKYRRGDSKSSWQDRKGMAGQAAEKVLQGVIRKPFGGLKNLLLSSLPDVTSRFFATLRMTSLGNFSATYSAMPRSSEKTGTSAPEVRPLSMVEATGPVAPTVYTSTSLYRIYRDLCTGAWYVDASYD